MCRCILKTGRYLKIFPTSLYSQPRNDLHISGVYDPDVEVEVRKRWKEKKEENFPDKNTFSMILPPPNITGNLHLGHALTITAQDVISRWKLMKSNEVCWVPGFDHAGVATQAIVERSLFVKHGVTRQRLGQEKLLEEIWAWRREKGKTTLEQIKTLGPVLDWKREIFTLDKEQKESVTSALRQLWEAGLIYRKASLVNWCCHLGSVLSDIEVTNMNLSGPTLVKLPGHEKPVMFGRLLRFAYSVEGLEDEVVVATTRPETIFGDVAVAVHPSDQRFSHLHGAVLRHPLTGEAVPLVLDNNVDPTYGTGAVKITPAHDHLDYKIGERHNLPLKEVINESGKLTSECGSYCGLNRWEAREKVIQDLAKRGFLRGLDSHELQISVCSRTGDVIELILKAQWYIKCKEMAKKASSSVSEGHLVLDPEKYNKIWFKWMENIEDWCISRQVWWGHDIPFYHCTHGTDSEWLCANNEEEALIKARNKFKSAEVTIKKDTDVLDTWFSSALLPFTAFGWPKQTEDLRKYYPLSLMVTGNDILFFWVARMVMLGIQLTNQLPFKNVLLHGIICDKLGRKMSKSKGNVIDPMDIVQGTTKENLRRKVMESHENGLIDKEEVQRALKDIGETYLNGIPKCGADSLRFTLLSQKIKNTFISFNLKECNANRLFCNKLWQAMKFALYWSDKLEMKQQTYTPKLTNLGLMDRWILCRLSLMVDVVNNTLEMNEFHLSTASLKSFIYTDLCGVYIECIKPILKSDNTDISTLCCEVLLYCLEVSLRCLSPFMPHICEELYRNLPCRTNDSIIKCTWPSHLQLEDNELDGNVQEVLNVIEAIRRMKAENRISSIKDVAVHIVTKDTDKFEIFNHPIQILSRSFKIQISKELPLVIQSNCLKEIVNHSTQIYMEATGLSIEPEGPKKMKLIKKLDRLQKMRLDKGYERVLPEIQQAHSEKILTLKSKLKLLNELEEKNQKEHRK